MAVTEASMEAALKSQASQAGSKPGEANQSSGAGTQTPESGTEPSKTEPLKASLLDKSFEKLMATQAETRTAKEALKKEREELKAQRERYAQFDAALERKDPMALLNAAKFGYADVVTAVRGEKVQQKDEPVDELAALRAKVDALENERRTEKRGSARQRLVTMAAERAKAFPLVTELGEHEAAVQFIDDFIKQNGEPPAETPEDALDIALEAVNQKLTKEKARWAKVLTPAQQAEQDAAKASEKSPAVEAPSVAAPKTLTNAMTASVPAKKVQPKNAEDYQAEAAAYLKTLRK